MEVLLTTLPDQETAENLATQLVTAGLAACGTCLPGAVSIYQWEGKLERSQECLLLLKSARGQECQAKLKELHPYDVPEILHFAPDSVLPAYREWVEGIKN